MTVADRLEPYPLNRDSGIPWLGFVPEHWEIRRLKYLLRERDSRSDAGREQLLRVSQYTGVTERASIGGAHGAADTRAESLVGYKLVEPDDLVVNIMLAWNGSLGVSRYSGITSPAYCVYRFRRGLDPWYFHYLLRSASYRARIKAVSTGVVDSRLRLYTDDLYALPVPVPPTEEQRLIVCFLDDLDRRTRRAIRAKQQLIAFLSEKERALIHGAVTRGLDPNVRMKPSGLGWLGDVPEHWSIGAIKSELLNLNARRVPLSSTERGSMADRRYDYYGASGVIDKVDDYLFDDDLVLIAEDGANLALRNLPLAVIARGKFWVNNHAHILKPRRGSLEYFAALLECVDFRPWLTGAAQPKLTQDRLMAIKIPVPPDSEQFEIAAWIERETSGGKDAIAKARQQLDLLREYQASLIADVVTGRLDVLDAAARLPHDLEEVAPLYEIDTAEEASSDPELETVEA
jgi:type I restriction enzyme S subunit